MTIHHRRSCTLKVTKVICLWGTRNRFRFSNDILSHINIYYSEHSQLFLLCWLLTAITVSGTNPYKELTLRPCCNISHAWINLKQRAWPILFYKITKIVRALWLAERRVCMRVCKHGWVTQRYTSCEHATTRFLEGSGELSTVMQTLDFISGLYNCLEFSQPLWCLYQAMQTRKTVSIA